MTIEELEAEFKEVSAERDRQYWLFTRTARAKPVDPKVTKRFYELQELIREKRSNGKSL